MEIQIKASLSEGRVDEAVRNASPGDTLNTQSAEQFDLIKQLMIRNRRIGLRVCLLDEDGYIIRQVSSRKREDAPAVSFNDKQLTVLRALERVLEHCEREGIALIGYSDELVAVPRELVDLGGAAPQARSIETLSVYRGAEQYLEME